ncbi:MoaD/ThiS family protein [Planctomicrobium sp. SH664]|uniref:MoaD/ThiS family protein n=1 Tax=Planctomicrobium sp. SH664 TaxID=3448125 RepID=UPI003F5BB908
MLVTVQLFARARELTGQETVTVDLPHPSRVRDLQQQLGIEYPVLVPLLPHLLIAINHAYAAPDDPVPAEVPIACFPPVSGG